jgi:hypothetical protein
VSIIGPENLKIGHLAIRRPRAPLCPDCAEFNNVGNCRECEESFFFDACEVIEEEQLETAG